MEKRTALVMTGLHGHGLGELALKIPVCLLGETAFLRARAHRKDSEITKCTRPTLSLSESELNTPAYCHSVGLWPMALQFAVGRSNQIVALN